MIGIAEVLPLAEQTVQGAVSGSFESSTADPLKLINGISTAIKIKSLDFIFLCFMDCYPSIQGVIWLHAKLVYQIIAGKERII